MRDKDYYKILGITDEEKNLPKDDFLRMLKKRYRELCVKYHPDKHPDDKDAEAKFKDIVEANEVLSDYDGKKAQYDNPHMDFDLGDIMSHFAKMSSGFGGAWSGFADFGDFGEMEWRGADVQGVINVTLEEVLSGCTREVRYNRTNSYGQQERCTVNIDIPPGVEDHEYIQVPGMGHGGIVNGKPIKNGNLIVCVHYKEHPRFKCQMTNLYSYVDISVFDAMLGKTLTITGLDGKELTINIPEGTNDKDKIMIKGEGLPIRQISSVRNNLFVYVNVHIPKNLNDDVKSLIQKAKKKWLKS